MPETAENTGGHCGKIVRHRFNNDSNFSFIINLFYWNGTALPNILPQLVAISIFTLTMKLVWVWAELESPDLPRYHSPLDAIRVRAGVACNYEHAKLADNAVNILDAIRVRAGGVAHAQTEHNAIRPIKQALLNTGPGKTTHHQIGSNKNAVI
jgi:hypothetical protein